MENESKNLIEFDICSGLHSSSVNCLSIIVGFAPAHLNTVAGSSVHFCFQFSSIFCSRRSDMDAQFIPNGASHLHHQKLPKHHIPLGKRFQKLLKNDSFNTGCSVLEM